MCTFVYVSYDVCLDMYTLQCAGDILKVIYIALNIILNQFLSKDISVNICTLFFHIAVLQGFRYSSFSNSKCLEVLSAFTIRTANKGLIQTIREPVVQITHKTMIGRYFSLTLQLQDESNRIGPIPATIPAIQ